MASEPHEWSVPAPVRMLLWWPAISFVLVIADPEAATGVIVGAGLVLALLGGLLATAARRLARRREGEVARETTMEIFIDLDPPTARIPRVPPQRDAA